MKTHKYPYSRHKSTRQQTSSTVIFSEEKEQILKKNNKPNQSFD